MRWAGETVCVIASGPSLTIEQIETARQKATRFIAVNDSYKLAPFADALYACDGKWWDFHHELQFHGEKWTQDVRAARKYSLRYLPGRRQPGLGRDCVHFGSNSGYQAINLAYLWGASKIILIGFDCKPINGKPHWFGKHPEQLNQTQPYAVWIENFKGLAADIEAEGIEVINCSPDSALDGFKKAHIADA